MVVWSRSGAHVDQHVGVDIKDIEAVHQIVADHLVMRPGKYI
jgi:hypothetical protein